MQWRALVVTLALISPSPYAQVAAPQSGRFDYLYIDANEDQASGGHGAVRIDSDVFHYQFSDGLLTLARDDWADFQLSYRGYQNRNIYATQLDISDETHHRLRTTFVQRHITQSAQRERLAEAQADVELLRSLTDPSMPEVLFPGMGFFARRPPGPVTDFATGFHSLRDLIAARYGAGFLRRSRAELADQLSRLDVQPLAVRPEDFDPGTLPRPSYAFSQQYADLVANLRTVDVLSGGWWIDPQQRTIPGPMLGDGERAKLGAVVDQFEQRLLELVSSRRPDRGRVLLLGLARLAVMRHSLQEGRWIFLDIHDADSEILPVGPALLESLPGLTDDAYQLWVRARLNWLPGDTWREDQYSELEMRAVNWAELQRVAAGAPHWRLRQRQGIPRGLGHLRPLPRPLVVRSDGKRLREAVEESLAQAEQFSSSHMNYQLLERNCVSELFGTIEQALADGLRSDGLTADTAAIQRESVVRLGGWIDPSPVPFYSSKQVRKHWRVVAYRELPSLRRMYTATQLEQDPSLGVLLRESNAFTSSVYRPSDEDSFFVFFTDGNALIRPVLGLVNLTSALGVAAVGVVQAPFDAGHNLSAGLRGALFSLPELGFQNIRKGTSTWLVPELRNPRYEQP